MKRAPYIETKLHQYKMLYVDVISVLSNMFSTLGTGIKADSFLPGTGKYYMDFDPETPVVPVRSLYPFIMDEAYQPYQHFVGLDGVCGNFNEAMDYFLKCIEITTPEMYLSAWSSRDIACVGGEDTVIDNLMVWKSYVPVIRQIYGIYK